MSIKVNSLLHRYLPMAVFRMPPSRTIALSSLAKKDNLSHETYSEQESSRTKLYKPFSTIRVMGIQPILLRRTGLTDSLLFIKNIK